MKTSSIFAVVILSLMSFNVLAQNLEQVSSETSTAKLSIFDFNAGTNHSIDLRISSLSQKTNRFLTGTGFLLQGLKFNSAVDQFNAVTPFDFRAYKPLTFSSYSKSIQKNQLLLNSIQPIK